MRYGSGVRAGALRLLMEGCSARQVEARIGVSNKTVARWASLAGMQLRAKTGGLEQEWPPVLIRSARLCLAQRVVIGCRLRDGRSLRAIAAEVGVAASTVSKEVARGSRDGSYDPGWSERRAARSRRRPRPSKLGVGTELRAQVRAGLNRRLSPQQIAHRLVLDFPDRDDLRVSHETIYQALYVQGRGALRDELRVVKAVRTGRTSRKPHSKLPARPGKPWLAGAHISLRPADVEDRAVPGHWEGDLVVGPYGRSALITLVERSSRFCLISRLPGSRDSETVVDKLSAMVSALPAELLQSLTWDQGSEMARHARFQIATGCQVFFCDPHSPWQRGSNENLNGLIRDFYPKGTSFADITDADIDHMQQLLNTRPRMTLNWHTPAEILNQQLTVALTT